MIDETKFMNENKEQLGIQSQPTEPTKVIGMKEIKKRPLVSSVPKMDKPPEKIKKKSLKAEQLTKMIMNEVIERGVLRFHDVAPGVNVPICLPSKKADADGKLPINQCRILPDAMVYEYFRQISEYLGEKFGKEYSNPEIFNLSDFNARQALAVIRTHNKMLRGKNAVTCVPFAFLSEDCHTFCRIDFDLLTEYAPTPNWDYFFENLTNTDAVKMFIGSLFDPNSNRSQYLWIAGNGGNGKTTIANVISKAFGNFVRFDKAPVTKYGEDKFWTHGLLNKRLVVLDDCDRPEFVRSGLFKSLTGTSKCRVEQKGRDAYDAEFTCKFFITSNQLPQLSSETADQRRIILSTTKNTESFPYDPQFEERLKSELPYFISNCYKLYWDTCSDGRPIPTSKVEAEKIGESFNEEVNEWLVSNFEFTGNPDHSVKLSVFIKKLKDTDFNKTVVYSEMAKRGAFKKTEGTGFNRYRVFSGVKEIFPTNDRG